MRHMKVNTAALGMTEGRESFDEVPFLSWWGTLDMEYESLGYPTSFKAQQY
jgi:hypothetical protein